MFTAVRIFQVFIAMRLSLRFVVTLRFEPSSAYRNKAVWQKRDYNKETERRGKAKAKFLENRGNPATRVRRSHKLVTERNTTDALN